MSRRKPCPHSRRVHQRPPQKPGHQSAKKNRVECKRTHRTRRRRWSKHQQHENRVRQAKARQAVGEEVSQEAFCQRAPRFLGIGIHDRLGASNFAAIDPNLTADLEGTFLIGEPQLDRALCAVENMTSEVRGGRTQETPWRVNNFHAIDFQRLACARRKP